MKVDLEVQELIRQKEFDDFFITCAFAAANLSRAVRTKVGAILVRDKRIIATGYNGQPYNFENSCEIVLENGELKTKSTVVHAELNAILFCARHGIKTENSSLYITMSPCVSCAITIIQAGIKEVIFADTYRDESGISLLNSANIRVEQYVKSDNKL